MAQKSPPAWARTRFTRLLGIDLPIVLGPFGGASSTTLVARVSAEGGLGSYGAYGLEGERILAVTAEIRALTDRPFALNLWVPHDGSEEYRPSADEFARHLAPLLPYFAELGVDAPECPERFFPDFDEQFEAALEARPAALSFVYGAPPPDLIQRAKERGITLIGTATTVGEAVYLEQAGMDVIVATGLEAAGHRVSFLAQPEDSLVGSLALVPQVADAVRVPVIAAGGIASGRQVAAVLMLGADAAQVGTAFLATEESEISELHRAALLSGRATHTALTRAYSGRLARGIPNEFSERVAAGIQPVAPFPVQSWLMGRLKKAAIIQGRGERISLWAGQSAGMIRFRPAAEVMADLVGEADRLLAGTAATRASETSERMSP